MKVMLAALETGPYENIRQVAHRSKYILSSYWYLRKKTSNEDLMKLIARRNSEDNFMLDSGAFTAIEGRSGEVDWDKYISDYIEFIKKYNIKRYIEMDIDVIVGYEKVLEFRNRMEQEIGYQSIPVFHVNRGLDEWYRMVDEYDYVAIGDLSQNDVIRPKHYSWFFKMIDYAYSKGVKVHGLGFTKKETWEETMLYSCDSSSWTMGRRYGRLFKFDKNRVKSIDKPKGARANYKLVDKNNYLEWCKLQRYADKKGWKTFKYKFEISLSKLFKILRRVI